MPGALRRSSPALVSLAIAILFLAACTSGPRPVQLGAEECAHCRMVISDGRYAAQLMTAKGRSYSFDDVACMVAFVNDAAPNGAAAGEPAARGHWVADFDAPGEWIPVEQAVFVRSDALRTPMGGGLSAHATVEAASALQAEVGGVLTDWVAVLRDAGRGHDHAHH
jgi:copper chaperone NosL